MQQMFSGATNFNQDISNWDVSRVINLVGFLDEAESFSNENYDALLHTWASLNLQDNVKFSGSLNYCMGELARQHIIDTYSWEFFNDAKSPDCDNSIIPGSSFLEYDSATCENELLLFPFLKYSVETTNQSSYFLANQNGEFAVSGYAGDYSITPELENPEFFNISPDTIHFSIPLDDPTFELNFCITPSVQVTDVEISIIPLNIVRAGFDVSYKIILTNKGTTIVSDKIELSYPSSLMEFKSAVPVNTSLETDKIIWEYSDLGLYESRTYLIDFTTNSPMDTPPLSNGDILSLKTTAFPLNLDYNNSNNYACLNQTVVNSFDPNDKTCLEGSTLLPEMVGEYLHYQIRFENTGTANALNVRVRDVIDRTRFDIASLEIIDASHPMQVRIVGDEVDFVFENIMLPFDDDNNDGYLVFKIKTLPDLVLGDEISNEANIFFDFNFPILTNTATTTVEIPSSTTTVENNLGFQISPNPVKHSLHIDLQENIASIEVFNLQGKLVHSENGLRQTQRYALNTSTLVPGAYLIQVISDTGKLGTKKFVKI